MAGVPADYLAAAQRWGSIADRAAQPYHLSGAQLLLGIGSVETTFSHNLGITSSAGARGPMQFEPSTRDAILRKYGVDAYASVSDAVHAAALYLRDSGLGAYNPGSSSYIGSVITAAHRVGNVASGPAGAQAAQPSSSSSVPWYQVLIKVLMEAAFVAGGGFLILRGMAVAFGSQDVPTSVRTATGAAA